MAGDDRFATSGKDSATRKGSAEAQNSLQRFFSKPPPAQIYGGISTGAQMGMRYEANTAPAIDGSSRLLRSLSPFILQIEPPLVFGSQPAFLDDNKDPNINVNIYRAAGAGSNRYSDARSTLARSNYATADYGFVNQDEYVSRPTGAQRVSAPGSNTADTVTAREDLNPSSIGKPAIADLNVAVDIAQQLKAVLATPPLVLLINPQTIEVSIQKVEQYGDRTKFGYIHHAWGEEQRRLNITARCGAFISGGRGVHFASKHDSAAWQNLMAAFRFYKNNGYIHDIVGGSYANHFVGAISITYDSWVYIGNMESLSWSHDSSNELGGVQFSMEFVASTVIDSAPQPFNVLPMRKPNVLSVPRNTFSAVNNFFESDADTSATNPNQIPPGALNVPPQQGSSNPSLNTFISTSGFQPPQTNEQVESTGVNQDPDPFRLG